MPRRTPGSRETLPLAERQHSGPGLSPGQTFAGYRIEQVIGRGGMGVVYRARQTRPSRIVALKVLAPEHSASEEFRRRFERESELAAAIEHPNVVPVYEVGEVEGLLFIAMRFIEGTDLERLGAVPLDTRRAARIVSQVGSALDAAHARGLVHRDVKPANVLISGAGGSEAAYLSDFGVARTQAAGGTVATRPGEWVGTADYMAPEAFEGTLDARSDIYSLACVLYRALTGEVPFPRDLDLKTMYAHLQESPPAARDRVPAVPEALDEVIVRGMRKDPAERFPSAGDLGRAALAATGEGLPLQRERSVATGPAARDGGSTVARRFVAGIAILAVIAGGLIVADPFGGDPSAPSAPVVGKPIPVGDGPVAVAADEDVVLVANGLDDSVSIVDPAEARAVGKPIPVAGEPGGIAVSGDGAWVVSVDAGTVTPLDLRRQSPGKPIRVGSRPSDVAIGFGSVWVSVYDEDRLVRVEDGKVISSVRVGDGPTDVAAGEGFVWVVNAEDDTMTKVNPATNEPVGSAIPVNNAPESVTVGHGAIWVGNVRNDTVTVVEPARSQAVGVVRVGERPDDLAAGDSDVWVANFDAGTVSRIDPVSRAAEEDPIEIGGGPGSVAVAGETAWVAGFDADTITPITR